MQRRLYSDDNIEAIYRGAVRVLGEMGMKVENRHCLEALERFGAKIDYPNERALFSPEVIDRMLEIVKADNSAWGRSFPSVPPNYVVGGGGTCPLYYDDEKGERRRATEADCIRALKIVEASPAVCCEPPVSNSDCPPKFEAIRCLQLGIETLNTTMLAGTDLFYPEQVPFAVELGLLYRNDPAWFLSHANLPTSPLIISKLVADLAVAKIPYKVRYAVPAMPVAGANAPMTPIGTAVIGIAEILGSFVLAKALDPETPVAAGALCAMMDMRIGSMVYVAPEVFAADMAIVETFEVLLRLPCEPVGTYIDAKLPGMRAVYEKLMRCLGLGLYSYLTGMHGTLDQGKVFSPTQMMLDYDMHQFLAAYTAEPTVNEDTLAIEAILDIGWDGSGYLMHEHTVKHMRDSWSSLIYGRASWVSFQEEMTREHQHLANAQASWRDNLANYTPPSHSDGFLKELRAICDKAKDALCG